ncbi:MAG: hypothetical protein V7636_1686, partial [Actinomycetota bacterium]
MISTFGRSGKKLLVAAVAATVGLASVAALVPGVAGAAQTVTTQRYAGTNRYGTSAAVAAAAFPGGSNNIIVASGQNYPDGLAAATLAGAVGGPVLLTATGSLSQETSNAIGSVDGGAAGPGTIWIVGGTAAVSTNVRNQIKALGYSGANFKELGGATRYETAAAVAAAAAAASANVPFNGLRTAIIASGQNFPDALSAGPIAYVNKMPILLTQTASLNSSTKQALTDRSIQQVIIMGGTAAVSQATADAIAAMGISVVRVGGTDRFDTAYLLATLESKSLATGGFGFDDNGNAALDPTADAGVDQIVLASGLNFPDALSASTLAGIRKAPILLMASAPAKTKQFASEHSNTLDNVAATGGTGVIPDADLTDVKTSSTTTTPTATITAPEGSRKITVVFSENVNTVQAQNPANYQLRSGALPANTTLVYTSLTKTLVITLPGAAAPLATNDLFTVLGGVVGSATTPQRFVPTTNFTVANDTTPATATLRAAVNNPTCAPSATCRQVTVVFSEPVTTNDTPNTAGAFDPGDVTSNGGQTTTGGVKTLAPNAFQVTFGSDLAVGNTITLSGGTTWADLGGNNPTSTFATTVVSDTTAPTLSSATGLSLANSQAAKALTGNVTITAKSGGAADGAVGNGWTITVNDNNGALSVVVDSTNKVVTINSDNDNSAGAQVSSATVVSALNGNSAFAALFAATETGATSAFVAGGGGNLAGGTTALVIPTTYSEGMDSTTIQGADFDLDTNGDGIAEIAGAGCNIFNPNCIAVV